MGIVSKLLSQSNNMKFLLVLAVAAYAKAEAEADPGFVYSVGHAPLVFNTLPYAPLAYHHPLVYTAAAGCRNNEGSLVPCAHGVLPALAPLAVAPAAPAAAEDDAVVSVEKREATAEAEAEADPEADPWLAYYAAHPYAYGYGYHYAPHAYSYAPFSYAGVYSHYGLPHHFGYYGKSEAEADPEADPWLSYYGLGYAAHPYGYGYHLGYSGYLPFSYGYHGVGCRNGYGALVPCAGR